MSNNSNDSFYSINGSDSDTEVQINKNKLRDNRIAHFLSGDYPDADIGDPDNPDYPDILVGDHPDIDIYINPIPELDNNLIPSPDINLIPNLDINLIPNPDIGPAPNPVIPDLIPALDVYPIPEPASVLNPDIDLEFNLDAGSNPGVNPEPGIIAGSDSNSDLDLTCVFGTVDSTSNSDSESDNNSDRMPGDTLGPRLHLSDFDGGRNEAKTWLQRFNLLASNYTWTDDVKLLRFQFYMTGYAAIWLNSLTDGEKDTWAHIHDAFKAHFLVPESRVVLDSQLSQRKLKPGETLDEFYQAILTIGEKANKSHEDLASAFLDGLPQACREYVLSTDNHNLANYLARARLFLARNPQATQSGAQTVQFSEAVLNVSPHPSKFQQDRLDLQYDNVVHAIQNGFDKLRLDSRPPFRQSRYDYRNRNRDWSQERYGRRDSSRDRYYSTRSPSRNFDRSPGRYNSRGFDRSPGRYDRDPRDRNFDPSPSRYSRDSRDRFARSPARQFDRYGRNRSPSANGRDPRQRSNSRDRENSNSSRQNTDRTSNFNRPRSWPDKRQASPFRSQQRSPSREGRGESQDNACFSCGKLGHWSRECTAASKN